MSHIYRLVSGPSHLRSPQFCYRSLRPWARCLAGSGYERSEALRAERCLSAVTQVLFSAAPAFSSQALAVSSQPSALSPQPSALSPQLSALCPQPSAPSPQLFGFDIFPIPLATNLRGKKRSSMFANLFIVPGISSPPPSSSNLSVCATTSSCACSPPGNFFRFGSPASPWGAAFKRPGQTVTTLMPCLPTSRSTASEKVVRKDFVAE